MKAKTKFRSRLMSMLLVTLLAFSMLPTAALAADTTEDHIHTEECVHEDTEEITVDTEPVTVDTTESEAEAESVAEITVETEEVTVSETDDPYSGTIGESSVAWSLDPATGRLIINGSGDCENFTSADDQPWAAVRGEIIEVWFYDMDALAISDLAYWFDGCTALTMAEIPYTTPVVGERAFADCPALRTVLVYHDGGFTIGDDAFYVSEPSVLEVRYVPSSEATASILASYDWKADNRAAFYEDVYGISMLATGTCSLCDVTCSYTLDYEQWTEDVHCVRHWCSNCGLDQCGGILAGNHSYGSSGYCSLCGYYNSAYDTSCSHSSYSTTWVTSCDWVQYCKSCGEELSSGTTHGPYTYGDWYYYSSTYHRRTYTCSYGDSGTYSESERHSTTTSYSNYSSTQHSVSSYCATCDSTIGSTSYESHDFDYGDWESYSSSQHRRSVSCSACDYSTYEYATHSLSYGSWVSSDDSQHSRTASCSTCGYSTTEYADHSLTYGDWEVSEGDYYSSKHKRIVSCSCGYSTVEYESHSCYGVTDWEYADKTYHKRYENCECGYTRYLYSYHSYSTTKKNISDTEHTVTKTCSYCDDSSSSTEAHSFSYGSWTSSSDTRHQRKVSCSCKYSITEYGDHADTDDDGYCDTCSYLMTRFSVTLPAAMVMTVSEDGEIHTADNVAIVNNSTHGVEITSVTVTAAGDWTIVPYACNMAAAKVDSRLIGFWLNGTETTVTGDSEMLSLPTNWTIDSGDTFPLEYDAIVSATSATMKNEQVLTLVFVIDWAPR